MLVCLGEALVDLVCERPVPSLADADSFRRHPGGALANVAIAAQRAGAGAALVGGVGDDAWGRWLHSTLASEGVDLRWFSLVAGARTPFAFVAVDEDREPSFDVHGTGIAAGVLSARERIGEAIDAATALLFGSNTLVGEPERELTLEARRLALDRGVPILFDPNLRPGRWDDPQRAIGFCRSICEGAFCVRANEEEAQAIAGVSDAGDAADRLTRLGARLGVVTLGARGAVLRGASEAETPGAEVEVVSPVGAGDAFMGTLAAGLARAGWDASRGAEAMPAAIEAGGAACERWGAVA